MRVVHISLDGIVLCGKATGDDIEIWRRYSRTNFNPASKENMFSLRNRLDNPAFAVEGIEYCRECFLVDSDTVDTILAISSLEVSP